MKRRGFLKALGIALAVPVVPVAALAAPISGIVGLDPAGRIPRQFVPGMSYDFVNEPGIREARGMTSCVYQIDEAAFFPNAQSKLYNKMIAQPSAFGEALFPSISSH